MDDKDNNLATPEITNEPNTNFDGILNNAPTIPPAFVPEENPLDQVRMPTRKKRSRELDR